MQHSQEGRRLFLRVVFAAIIYWGVVLPAFWWAVLA